MEGAGVGGRCSSSCSSKFVVQLDPEAASVLLNHVLQMVSGAGKAVFRVEQVVNTRRQLQTLDQFPAEQSQIGYQKIICPASGEGLDGALILKLQAGENLILVQRHAQIELGQVPRRPTQFSPRAGIL